MSLNVCPLATVKASAEVVWSMLENPGSYLRWWDFSTDSITPPGRAQAGQVIQAHLTALVVNLRMKIRVNDVDDSRRQLDLTTSLPFGITVHNHIVVNAQDDTTSRVSFG